MKLQLPSALEFVRKMQNDTRNRVYSSIDEAQAQSIVSEYLCAEIIEALEKQTPKKPDILCETWVCPNCRQSYEFNYGNYDYCPNCGQKIDWGEGE